MSTIGRVSVNGVSTVHCFPSLAPFPLLFTTTSDVTSSSITVQWRAVECFQRSGYATGYSVRYGVEGSGSTQTMSVSGGTMTEATISGLDSATNYAIAVAAVNSAGTGVYSDLFKARTDGMAAAYCNDT